MSSRIHLAQRRNSVDGEQSAGLPRRDKHRTRDERTYLFRSVLFAALSVTAVMYGLAVYYGLSNAQHTYAGKEFKNLASQAGEDIRNTFTRSAKSLSYLAETVATQFPLDEDWPTVLLPGFVKDLPYLRDTT
ncbi:hypothetical protein B484DRAFT_407753, partial [Ochromonadaceae sp. CCMP2298]